MKTKKKKKNNDLKIRSSVIMTPPPNSCGVILPQKTQQILWCYAYNKKTKKTNTLKICYNILFSGQILDHHQITRQPPSYPQVFHKLTSVIHRFTAFY